MAGSRYPHPQCCHFAQATVGTGLVQSISLHPELPLTGYSKPCTAGAAISSQKMGSPRDKHHENLGMLCPASAGMSFWGSRSHISN